MLDTEVLCHLADGCRLNTSGERTKFYTTFQQSELSLGILLQNHPPLFPVVAAIGALPALWLTLL